MAKGKKGSNGSRSGQNTTSKKVLTGPPVGATTYSGPAMIKPGPKDEDMTVVRLSYAVALTSGVSGAIFQSFQNDPSLCAEWSSYVGLYEEHRVLSTVHRFMPTAINYTTSSDTKVYGNIVWSLNRNAGLTPPANSFAAWQKSNAIIRNAQQSATFQTKAGSAQEMLFRATTAPGATWQLDANGEGFSISATWGTVYVEFLIQFRNRA